MSEKEKLIEMASSSLSDAKMVKEESDRLFWNSIYYTLFYAAKAALKNYGVEPALTREQTANWAENSTRKKNYWKLKKHPSTQTSEG